MHAAAHARAEELRSEYVVAVVGRVVKRQKVNPDLTSGEVEIVASELRILNMAKTPPFVVEDDLPRTKRRACVTAISICGAPSRAKIWRCATA